MMGKKTSNRNTETFESVKSKKKNDISNAACFYIALVITMTVLSIVSFYVLFYYNPNEDTPVQQTVSNVAIKGSSADCINLMICIKQSESSTALTSCTLLRIDLVNSSISVLTLPPQTALYTNDKPISLSAVFESSKEQAAMQLFNSYLNTQVNKYITMTEEKALELIKDLGGIDYTLPYDIYYEKDKKIITLYEGLSYFDSQKIKKLLDYNNFKEGKIHKYLLQSHLVCLYLNKYLPDMTKDSLEELYSWVMNNCITNLTAVDLQSRLAYIISLAQNIENPATELVYSGEYTEDETYYDLTDSSRLIFQNKFK